MRQPKKKTTSKTKPPSSGKTEGGFGTEADDGERSGSTGFVGRSLACSIPLSIWWLQFSANQAGVEIVVALVADRGAIRSFKHSMRGFDYWLDVMDGF